MNLFASILSDFLDVPLLRNLYDAMWGPAVKFGVDGSAVLKSDVQLLLHKYGVKSWGYHLRGGGGPGEFFGGILNGLLDRIKGDKASEINEKRPQDMKDFAAANPEPSPAVEAPEMIFSVNKKKARWALRVLEMNGYPVTTVPKEATETKRAKRGKWRL